MTIILIGIIGILVLIIMTLVALYPSHDELSILEQHHNDQMNDKGN